jgi:hypothetical protein
MPDKQPIYRVHALRCMFERHIDTTDIEAVLEHGEVIEDYPGDFAYPSRLMLGWVGTRPLHVVVARGVAGRDIIVTVYEPDAAHWTSDLRTRRT